MRDWLCAAVNFTGQEPSQLQAKEWHPAPPYSMPRRRPWSHLLAAQANGGPGELIGAEWQSGGEGGGSNRAVSDGG